MSLLADSMSYWGLSAVRLPEIVKDESEESVPSVSSFGSSETHHQQNSSSMAEADGYQVIIVFDNSGAISGRTADLIRQN
jgi:hypothetical protein